MDIRYHYVAQYVESNQLNSTISVRNCVCICRKYFSTDIFLQIMYFWCKKKIDKIHAQQEYKKALIQSVENASDIVFPKWRSANSFLGKTPVEAKMFQI